MRAKAVSSIAARDRAGEHRLAGAWYVLEQDVAVAGERGQDQLDLVVLAAQHPLHVSEQATCDLDRVCERLLACGVPFELRAHSKIMAMARPRLGEKADTCPRRRIGSTSQSARERALRDLGRLGRFRPAPPGRAGLCDPGSRMASAI